MLREVVQPRPQPDAGVPFRGYRSPAFGVRPSYLENNNSSTATNPAGVDSVGAATQTSPPLIDQLA